jgi:hypothetical protein
MRKVQLLALAIVAAVAAFAGATVTKGSAASASPAHVHARAQSAPDLRVTLDRLLGEHAQLAIIATRKGYDGARDFNTAAAALNRNSVELAGAIGLVFGNQARNQFLNGRFMWRDHIRFFVQYTTALKRKNKAGQRKAVGSLMGYIEAFSGFLAGATGLPQNALRASIREHVMQLKGQIDAYSKRNYASAYRLQRQAYSHMFMTGDTLAAAITKKFPGRFRP